MLLGLAAAPGAAIVGWRAAALGGSQLQLSDVFDAGIVTASLVVLAFGQRSLKRVDWFLAAATGVAMGLLVPSTSFYPLLGWVARSGDAAWVGALDGVGVAATTNPDGSMASASPVVLSIRSDTSNAETGAPSRR